MDLKPRVMLYIRRFIVHILYDQPRGGIHDIGPGRTGDFYRVCGIKTNRSLFELGKARSWLRE
jgi:hypothetical protein